LNRKELEEHLSKLRSFLTSKTILWVTYLKGTSKTKTDINLDITRDYAGTLGLIGVFIFSVDEDWSALRLKVT